MLIAIFTFTVLGIAMTESLWLDELHTSWAVSGTWQEIASRAAAGNQSPLYFWLVGSFTETLGQNPEWFLRLPSTLAWLGAVALFAHHIRFHAQRGNAHGTLFALCVVGWISLDRLQWFFATEARPYAYVQLVSLAGWCCVAGIARKRGASFGTDWRPVSALIAVWCVLSIANIYIHLTAALPVFFQWITGLWLGTRKRGSDRNMNFSIAWIAAAIAVGLALMPLLQLAFPVWQRRSQWATFASDVSLSKAISMFPFVPILSCVLVGWMGDRLWPSKANPTSSEKEIDARILWWIAMLGPWSLAWVLAATHVAPMFHERFVFASAMPLFMVGAIELLRFRHQALRWIACISVAIAIIFSQSTASVWRAGYLVGNLRGEDWRGASQWISSQIGPEEPVLCFSRLIEADSSPANPIELPLEPALADYLAFPMHGVYQIHDRTGRPVRATPLLEDHRRWANQLHDLYSSTSNNPRPTRIWLVYRGSASRLRLRLAEFLPDLERHGFAMQATEPQRFGNLYVVQLRRR